MLLDDTREATLKKLNCFLKTHCVHCATSLYFIRECMGKKRITGKKVEDKGVHKGQEGIIGIRIYKESGLTRSNQSPWIFRRSFGMVGLFFQDVFKLGPKNREMEGQRRNLVPAKTPE
jgi:hypothetical protein